MHPCCAFSLAFPSSIWHCTWLYKILILVFLSFFIVEFLQLCGIKPVQYEADILPYQLACDNWSRMKSAFASNAKHKQEGYVSSKMDKIVYSGIHQCYVPKIDIGKMINKGGTNCKFRLTRAEIDVDFVMFLMIIFHFYFRWIFSVNVSRLWIKTV